MNIQPKGKIVLIEVDKVADQTKSGILLTAQNWKTLPPVGVVTAIGPDVKDRGLLGKKVIFERYTSIILPQEEDKIDRRFVIEDNILAVYDGEA